VIVHVLVGTHAFRY